MTALQGEPPQASQCREALGIANYVRGSIADWKRVTAALPPGEGVARVVDVLEGPNGVLTAMHVDALLMSVRRIGETKMTALINEAGIRHSRKQVRSLAPRQRRALIDVLKWMQS